MRTIRLGLLALLVTALLVTVPPGAGAQKRGGVIRVGVLGDPPTLDSHWTTANFVEYLTAHMYEALYTLDQNYQPIPMLAEGLPAASADGLVYTIKLRQGVKFHIFYERVPALRFGDLLGLRAMQAHLKGFNESMAFPRFYNVWLER